MDSEVIILELHGSLTILVYGNMKLIVNIDRYPAKMVSSLAENIINKYAQNASSLLDPFCGSSAILRAASQYDIPVSGCDINPYSFLLSDIKLNGFNFDNAIEICNNLIEASKLSDKFLPIDWPNINYWFTTSTLNKFERFRYHFKLNEIEKTKECNAILLALAIAVRPCSKCDQRSPKPFISKNSLIMRKGIHFDPFKFIPEILKSLANNYKEQKYKSKIYLADINSIRNNVKYSHIITSPPYINAQDYFRNHKLELYILNGLLPFDITNIKNKIIGRENNLSTEYIFETKFDRIESYKSIESKLSSHHLKVVKQYFDDMTCVFNGIRKKLLKGGIFIIICGDNLIDGEHIKTSEVLNQIILGFNFSKIDQFSDKIRNRMLPPKRFGHKGLIKKEIITVFQLN
jgi:hypothetical protein